MAVGDQKQVQNLGKSPVKYGFGEPTISLRLATVGCSGETAAHARGHRSPISGADDVVELERLVDLAEPLGAVGSAAAPTLVQREFELTQQARALLACRHVPELRTGTPRFLV